MYPLRSLRKCILNAAAEGNLDRLMMLLERADFDKKLMMNKVDDVPMQTPIIVAIVRGHSHIVEAIAKYYTEATDWEAGAPLLTACVCGSADCVRIIFKSLPHLRYVTDNSGYNLIQVAARKGRSDIVEVLIELGVDVNQTTWSHEDGSASNTCRTARTTALDIASGEGHTEVVKTLLKHGADPLKPSSKGNRLRSALCPAACNGHFEILKILSKLIPLHEDYGSHAVWYAAVGMNLTCLQYLLDNGATFNLDDEERILCTWKNIIKDHPKSDLEITRTIEIMLENGVPMKPLAAKIFLPGLCHVFRTPALKFLFASGLFEMMYSNVYQALDSNHCDRFACDFLEWCHVESHHMKAHTADGLRSVIKHLPHSFISVQRHFGKEFVEDHFGDENVKKFPSLQELCRWKIRCQIVSKQGYISQKLLSKLYLPMPLQAYLFYKVSCNRSCEVTLGKRDSGSEDPRIFRGWISDWDVESLTSDSETESENEIFRSWESESSFESSQSDSEAYSETESSFQST